MAGVLTDQYCSRVLYEDYLYARISEDERGTEKSVDRQLRESLELSERTGGRVKGTYKDNDISSTEGAWRPDFERMLTDLRTPNPLGVQRRVVCVHMSRLWRNRDERARYISLFGQLGLIIRAVNGPSEMDLRTAAGRLVADVLGAVDTSESEIKAERVRSAARERAEEGRANGPVLYGWQRVYEYNDRGVVMGARDVEHPEQAPIVREIVRRLLAGDTLKGITDDLNRRGVPAPRAGFVRAHRGITQADDGSRWGKTSVRKIATRPANVGMRIFHRGRPDEQLLPAAWPALVDRPDHDRVVALLDDPSRKQAKPGSRQHLLSWGIGECGVCGGVLRVAIRGNAQWGSKARLYVCSEKGCTGRNKAAVDTLVREHMVALLSRPDVADLLSGDQGAAARALADAEALRARLASAADSYAEGLITGEQLQRITAKLRPQIEAAEAEARSHRPSPHLSLVGEVIGDQARDRWDGLSLPQRRAVMEVFGVRVIIDRVARRGPGFDPSSVRVVPRQRAGD